MTKADNSGNTMLKKLFLQLLAVNVLYGLVQPVNSMINSMLTGSGLGLEALKVNALFLPVIGLVIASSMLFSVGTQINCSHLIGRGKNVKSLTQTAFLSALVFSIIFAIILIVFSTQIASLLGASDETSGQIQDTSSYIRGYAIGIPFIFLLAIMFSLLLIEGKKKFIIVLSVLNLVINISCVIIAIYVIDAGLFGVAFSTALANIVTCIIALTYFHFFSKMFRFSILGFRIEELRMIINDGFPSLTYYGSVVIRAALINFIVIHFLDSTTLAVVVVVSGVFNVVDAIIGACGDVTLLFESISYGERDIKDMRSILKLALLSSFIIFAVITVITILCSFQIAILFSEDNDLSFLTAASRAITITAIHFIPDVIAIVIKKHIQAVGRKKFTSLTNILTNVVYFALSAFLLVSFFGSDGLFLSYTVSYICTLITYFVYALLLAKKSHRRGFDKLLFLPANYIIEDKDVWTTSISNREECILASEEAARICQEKNNDKKRSDYVMYVIEEMSLNVVEHGFVEGRNNLIAVRMIFDDGGITISIKDNCPHFDPKYYYELVKTDDDIKSCMGIRLVMRLAKEVSYTNSLDMNNLMVKI